MSNGDETERIMNVAEIGRGALCQQMRLEHRYDKNGKAIVKEQIESSDDGDQDERYKKFALVSRRFFNDKNQLVQTKLDINSRPLLQVFSEIVKYYPAHPEMFSDVLTVDSPYMILYHHWKELKDYRNKTEDDDTRTHLNLLLDFMDGELGEDSRKADRLIETGHISFPLLWTIFRPGDLIMQLIGGKHQQLWRHVKTWYGQDDDGRFLTLKVTCSNCDGTNVGRHYTEITMYEGQIRPITNWTAYPLRFLENSDQIVEKLTQRGQRFLDLRGIHVRRYEGQLQMFYRHPSDMFSRSSPADYLPHRVLLKLLENDELARENEKATSYNIQGRIIVDMKTFVEENPYAFYGMVDTSELTDKASAHTIMSWESDDLMLFPPFVYGFSPSIMQWCRFFIDQLREPQWQPKMFNDLILPSAPKRVIRSLVSSHQYPDDSARDQQALKGKGLVILLQGTPGTGKTLTAEVASEVTERILLVMSSGGLGETVSQIDRNLTKLLQYAATWGAIVLIDEADVFLEERKCGLSSRLEQNSLVAVFLRQLEYFQGIVFLTTNRGTSLDPAIKSRIHLFLQFMPPDRQTQKNMWRLRLGKKDSAEQDFDIDKALEIVEKADMNGREISNAVQTIWTLAREEKNKVSLEHFRTFIEVWESFGREKTEGKAKEVIMHDKTWRVKDWLRKHFELTAYSLKHA